MKPRTKLQFQVIELSRYHLREIHNELLPWAKKECLDHKGFATKNRVVCMDCGEQFSPNLVKRKSAICPHCQTKLKVEQTKKRTDKQRVYFAIAEIIEDFQVIRNFELTAHYKTGMKAQYYCMEILQHWILPNGKREVIGRHHTVNWYCNSWNGDMEIRKNYHRGYYYNPTDKYDVYPYKYHPDSKFKPMYTKIGINHKLQGLTFVEAVNMIPENPHFETLLKAKRYSLLGYLQKNKYKINYHYWTAIKICLRNKYKIDDIGIWFDYIDLLEHFEKDLHNVKYVCPKNLKVEHDRLVKKKRKRQELEERELKKKRAAEAEIKFRELKSKFFDIEFSDGVIMIKVLSSVQDYVEEGDTLHHCVFTNDYHLRPDSIILSAYTNDQRLETIELSLETLKVVQCRGKFNKNTEHHDRIIKLVNKNKKLFKERLTA